jgi:hypothetical protein
MDNAEIFVAIGGAVLSLGVLWFYFGPRRS